MTLTNEAIVISWRQYFPEFTRQFVSCGHNNTRAFIAKEIGGLSTQNINFEMTGSAINSHFIRFSEMVMLLVARLSCQFLLERE